MECQNGAGFDDNLQFRTNQRSFGISAFLLPGLGAVKGQLSHRPPKNLFLLVLQLEQPISLSVKK